MTVSVRRCGRGALWPEAAGTVALRRRDLTGWETRWRARQPGQAAELSPDCSGDEKDMRQVLTKDGKMCYSPRCK